MAYWLTLHYPFIDKDTRANAGVWVRPGKEVAAQNLKKGDLVFIYETYRNNENGDYPGAMSVVLLTEITSKANRPGGNWVKVANTRTIAKGKCEHDHLLKILNRKRLQSFGSLNSKLGEINYDQFCLITDYFPTYESNERLSQENAAEAYAINSHEGQGFASKEVRDLIENYSMDVAKRYLTENGYQFEDHHKSKPYDYFCKLNGKEFYIEVKGTQGEANEIFLTRNEVRWGNDHYKNMILLIVQSISVSGSSGSLRASGGEIKVIKGWKPDDYELIPISYRCNL